MTLTELEIAGLQVVADGTHDVIFTIEDCACDELPMATLGAESVAKLHTFLGEWLDARRQGPRERAS